MLNLLKEVFYSYPPVSDLAEPGTFAGNDAIVAFARSQQVKVVIHQLNAPLWEVIYIYLTPFLFLSYPRLKLLFAFICRILSILMLTVGCKKYKQRQHDVFF